MAILDILQFPDPRLRQVAQPVDAVDAGIATLIDDMLETMYDANGIGLAATQVNVHKQVVVIDLSEDNDQPMVLINPSYDILDGALHDYDEGCLSVPGYYETVSRPQQICLRALDRTGGAYEKTVDGLLAVCIQHEIDHLQGKLFVDYLSTLKRSRIKQKLVKERRLA